MFYDARRQSRGPRCVCRGSSRPLLGPPVVDIHRGGVDLALEVRSVGLLLQSFVGSDDVQFFDGKLDCESAGAPLQFPLGLAGNSPGIQRSASVAGKARRIGARELSEIMMPWSARADVTRRA